MQVKPLFFGQIRGLWRGAHLAYGRFMVDVLDHWTSPATGARYPSRWRIRAPELGLDLLVTPRLSNQEMLTARTTRVNYWEGAVEVQGIGGEGREVKGVGYVELTGYEKPFAAPM